MGAEAPPAPPGPERFQGRGGRNRAVQARSKAGEVNTRQRFKLGAGAALVTMLLGAVMVLAPGAGAEDGVQVVDVTICHRTNAIKNPYRKVTVSFSSSDGGETWTSPGDHLGSHGDGGVFDPAVHTENGHDWADIVPDVDGDGPFPGLNAEAGKAYLENDCQVPGSPGNAPVVIVEKVVPGLDQRTFDFSVSAGTPATGKAKDGASFSSVVVPGSVTLTEAEVTGYELTSVECTREFLTSSDGVDVIQEGAPVSDYSEALPSVSFTAAPGDIITCTFTNTPDAEPLPTGALSIDKVVDGTAPQPAGTKYGFTVACRTEAGAVTLAPGHAAFELTAADDPKVIDPLPAGATCTVNESEPRSAQKTTVKVGDAAAAEATQADGVTIIAGRTTPVVFTNTYDRTIPPVVETPTQNPPPGPTPTVPASLRIVKVVDALDGGEIPAAWAVDFDVEGVDFEGSKAVDDAVTSTEFTDLAVGSYTITERTSESDTSTLTDVDCVDQDDVAVVLEEDLADGVASLELTAGDEVVCTFTNTYPAVLPGGETPTEQPTEPTRPTPPTPPSEPAAEPTAKPANQVKGEVITRPQSLPRTGGEPQDLAGIGVVLVALGAAMVLGSKRQLARR